jgi:predicted DNA-binding transcriptional regulator YafY
MQPSSGEYIKSFPLHQSQKETKETPEEIYFEFFLHPTYDFMQEILSYGKEVTVLEPKCLVDDIRNHLQESLNRYLES